MQTQACRRTVGLYRADKRLQGALQAQQAQGEPDVQHAAIALQRRTPRVRLCTVAAAL